MAFQRTVRNYGNDDSDEDEATNDTANDDSRRLRVAAAGGAVQLGRLAVGTCDARYS